MMHTISFHALSVFVRDHVLAKPGHFEWSLQGFGMLRTYLNKELRLHIWDSRYRVPNVTEIHDHPWDLESIVLSGYLRNRRWRERVVAGDEEPNFHKGRIVCGPAPKVKEVFEVENAWLTIASVDCVRVGEEYSQNYEVLHTTEYSDGAVTVCRRTNWRADPDVATVCWPIGSERVSAEPRVAEPEEVNAICAYAREKWNGA